MFPPLLLLLLLLATAGERPKGLPLRRGPEAEAETETDVDTAISGALLELAFGVLLWWKGTRGSLPRGAEESLMLLCLLSAAGTTATWIVCVGCGCEEFVVVPEVAVERVSSESIRREAISAAAAAAPAAVVAVLPPTTTLPRDEPSTHNGGLN